MSRTAHLFVLLAVVMVMVVARPAPPAAAQRPTPSPGSGLDLAQLKRYGTRLALAVPGAGMGPVTTLQVANAGWRPIGVLVVELGAPPAASCPTQDTARMVRYRCSDTRLNPFALSEMTLPGTGVAATAAQSVLVYSLAADQAASACQQFADVQAGRMSLGEWERTAWTPGEPLAVLAQGALPNAETGLAGEVALGVAGITGGRPDRPGAGGLRQVLPAVWPAGRGGRAVALNMGTECATLNARVGAGDLSPCSATQALPPVQVPPLAAQALAVTSAGGPASITGQVQGEAILAAEGRDASGWWSYSGAGASNEWGGVAFPLAVGPLADTQAELYVTNVNVTATAKVELVMFDGNQGLHKLYADPTPLCAGGTRRYNVTQLAGTIPPTSGHPGAEGPPLLSLRIQGTSNQTQQAPMLAGVMIVKNGQGVTAYGGQANSVGSQLFQAIRWLQPGFGVWTVVPGVKKNAGPDRRTTFLAMQTMGNPLTDSGAYVDLYDAQGRVVAGWVPIRLGTGPAGFLDLGSAGLHLPDGFVGTAVVRGLLNRGIMAVVAMDVAAAPGAGDTLVSWPGVILPRWPDPSIPTATPFPTRDPRTPGAGRRTPTATPARGTPSATATPPERALVYLPYAARYRAPDHSAALRPPRQRH
jgi:hypothetical protein